MSLQLNSNQQFPKNLLDYINMNKIQSSTHKWIQKDRRVWVKDNGNMFNPDHDVFLQAKVNRIAQDKIFVSLKDQLEQTLAYQQKQHIVSYEDCQKLTYQANDVSDMVDLQELNQPELLFNLKRRYFNDNIFTYCGPTLVIINPYIVIPKLFNEQMLYKTQTYVFMQNLQYKTLQPHIYGLAAFCLWQLFENMKNQSIVISGQSGAGKTENTKYALKFLASLGKNIKQLINQKGFQSMVSNKIVKNLLNNNKEGRLAGIEDKILGCNQILQAFGNAKTIRNDNSSRFGKLILLLYGQTQIDIKSALITSYLLQKSRIVSVAEGERNYHIFYYFLKGTSVEQKTRLMLHDNFKHYKYLNQSSVSQISGVSDQQKMKTLISDFQNYFNPQQIDSIFKILSVVLNIGNLKFKKQFTQNNQEMAIATNPEYLKIVSKLMDIDYNKLEHSFHFKTRKLGVTVINSVLRLQQAITLQNSFAKNLYQKVFQFLVVKLNQKIQLQKIDLDQTNKQSFRKSIGLLDIFGFQVLQINSLQQFFINFANQKLQQLYVSYIFKQQQKDFLTQGLKDFSHQIDFQDNKPVIDIFEGYPPQYPPGLFHLINESSQLSRPDEELPQIISRKHSASLNKFIVIPRAKKGVFLINHSCSPVHYNTAGFSSRNKDQFPQQMLDIILEGNNKTIKEIVLGDGNSSANKNRTASKKFLGSKFLNQMDKLAQQLYASDCHFVRCIKPNSNKKPNIFNSQAVLQSLRYLGVLDSILIRKLGYIYRRPFKEFINKFYQIDSYIYGFAEFIKNKNQQDCKEECKKFVLKHCGDHLGTQEILLGNNKILIKESALNHLEGLAKQKKKYRIQCANKIKRMYRNAVFRQQVKKFLLSIKILKQNMLWVAEAARQKILNDKCATVQFYIKQYLLQKRFQRIKEQATKSVTKISAQRKMIKQRTIYLQTRKKIITLQANIRHFVTMGRHLKYKACRQLAMSLFEVCWRKLQNKNAVIIQKAWKGYKIRRQFKKIIEQIRRKLRLAKHKEYLMKIIAKKKYANYLNFLNRFRAPIVKMQAIVKGKLVHRAYNLSKQCAILIQRAYRRHLRKKYYLIKLWKDYRKKIYAQEKLKIRDVGKLGVQPMIVENVKYYPQIVGAKVQLYPQQIMARYGKGEKTVPDWSVNQLIHFHDKNTFQIYIADYDVFGCQYYKGQWLTRYVHIKQEMKRKNQYPIYLGLNQQFTSVISNKQKIYTFYADAQIKNSRIDAIGVASSMSLGGQAGYLLRADSKMYVWGYNYQNYIDQSQQLHVDCREVRQLSALGVVNMSCQGQNRFFVDEKGKAYHYKQDDQELSWKLQEVLFNNRITVRNVAASYEFVLFLTSNGQIYSQGTNKKGQLGLGNTSGKIVFQPTVIPFFAKNNKEMIETISVGMAHSVAKSKLGYVYTWGDNCFQQVSNKNVPYLHTPQPLENQQGKLKVLQAVAGARTTFLLLDHLKTQGMGTSSSFPFQKGIVNYSLQMLRQTSSCKNLVQIKLCTRWIRQISILYVNAIDLAHCKSGVKTDVPLKYAKMMAKQWIQDKVYPTYHQWTDNILQLSDLRKFKFATQSPQRNGNKQKSNVFDSQLDQLKALMELRKNSAVFKRAALQKMQEMMLRLNSKPRDSWSQSQKDIFNYIHQNSKLIK